MGAFVSDSRLDKLKEQVIKPVITEVLTLFPVHLQLLQLRLD